MRFVLRQIDQDVKLPDAVALEALEVAIPHEVVKAVVADLGVAEQRRRKLPAEIGLLLGIAMNLFTCDSLQQVLVKPWPGQAAPGATLHLA